MKTGFLFSFGLLLLLAAPALRQSPAPLDDAPVHVQRTQSASSAADVVTAAQAFIATLSASQQSTLIQAYNQTNVTKWSNLPVSNGSRLGLKLGDLTATQQAAALAVVQAAVGTGANEGWDELEQLRLADQYLAANGGGNGYGAGVYLLAFLGQPSTTGTWELAYGGHHMAVCITYQDGEVAGGSPMFRGVEPLTWTSGGTTYSPLGQEHDAMAAMLAGLSVAEQNTAKLSQRFSDVVLGPNGNGQFPTTKVGLSAGTLTATQKQLVLDAMAPWVRDNDDSAAARMMRQYAQEIDQTYIAYSGTTGLATNADYVRIDGPSVWVEFVCQNGVVFRNQIHYHSVYRDHYKDYGGNYYVLVNNKPSLERPGFRVYPSPATAGNAIYVDLAETAANATYTLRSLMGQAIASGSFRDQTAIIPTAGLAAGTYLVTVQVPGKEPAMKHVVVR